MWKFLLPFTPRRVQAICGGFSGPMAGLNTFLFPNVWVRSAVVVVGVSASPIRDGQSLSGVSRTCHYHLRF